MSERIVKIIRFIIFLFIFVSFGGCDLEEWAESPDSSEKFSEKDDPEVRRDSASLDEIEKIQLKEYEKYCRRPAQKYSWSQDDLKYWDKHREVWNWAENKRCKEAERRKK